MKPNDVTKSDYAAIWLEPLHHEDHTSEGRQWCQDDVWSDGCEGEECGGPTKYVRSDLYDEAVSKLDIAESKVKDAISMTAIAKIARADAESRLDSALGLLREVHEANESNMDATFLGGELEDRIKAFVVEKRGLALPPGTEPRFVGDVNVVERRKQFSCDYCSESFDTVPERSAHETAHDPDKWTRGTGASSRLAPISAGSSDDQAGPPEDSARSTGADEL